MGDQRRKVVVVFDNGGTTFRAGLMDPSTGEILYRTAVEPADAPEFYRGSERGHRRAQDRITNALEELFKSLSTELQSGEYEPVAVSIASRGAFKRGVDGKLSWVLRSHPTMEFDPLLVRATKELVRIRAANEGTTLDEKAIHARALVEPTFALEKTLTDLTHRYLSPDLDPLVTHDGAANLAAEVRNAKQRGLLPEGSRPALLIVGTGIGFAVMGDDGQPIVDADGHSPAISRIVVDEESGLTLTAATNGLALAQLKKDELLTDEEVIPHAVHYLAPVLRLKMQEFGATDLFVTGGVAEGLGPQFSEALGRELGSGVRVHHGEVQDVGLVGAGAIAIASGRVPTLTEPEISNVVGGTRRDRGENPLAHEVAALTAFEPVIELIKSGDAEFVSGFISAALQQIMANTPPGQGRGEDLRSFIPADEREAAYDIAGRTLAFVFGLRPDAVQAHVDEFGSSDAIVHCSYILQDYLGYSPVSDLRNGTQNDRLSLGIIEAATDVYRGRGQTPNAEPDGLGPLER